MEVMQLIVNWFSEAAKDFSLTMNIKKTEVLDHPCPRGNYNPPQISIDSSNLNAMEQFTYLGSVMSNDATVNKGVVNRLAKANISFGCLSKSI